MASASSPDPIKDAAVLGPIKAEPFGWPGAVREDASAHDAMQLFRRGGCDVLVVEDSAARFVGLLSRKAVTAALPG